MFKRYTNILKSIVIASLVFGLSYHLYHKNDAAPQQTTLQEIIEHPIYGTFTLTNPLEIEVVQSATMQRLKKIHQYGITYYAGLPYFFSRYDHSIGVFLLLKRFGLSENEQLAGMLHDASHTAFSHVAEKVFNHTDHHHSYQDTIHRSFLESQGIGNILTKYNLTVSDVMHKETDPAYGGTGLFKALEQDLPDLCADRIDYILEGGFYEHLITREEIAEILNHLRFNGESWFFTDMTYAKKFSDISLYLTEHVFSALQNDMTYQWIAVAIRKAFEIGLFSREEFCTLYDAAIWEKLEKSNDQLIKEMLTKIVHWEDYCEEGNQNNFDLHFKSKFRGVNPLVKDHEKLIRLTDLNSDYATAYNAAKARMQKGRFVIFKNPVLSDDHVK